MRSKLQVDVLLRAVADAAVASRAMAIGILEARTAAALDGLTEAIGADRACLCFTTGATPGRFDRFVSGGRPEVAPIGPALLGVPIDEVPEWSRAADLRPVARTGLSPALDRALGATSAGWVLSVALHEVDAVIGVLSIVGNGSPPDAELAPVLATTAELMHSVARRAGELSWSSPTLVHARLALDVVEEGVLFLDPHGRVVALNRAAREQLGCEPGDLDADAPIWEQFDVRLLDGAAVAEPPATEWFDRVGVLGPLPIRVVNRRGLVVSGRLTVRAVELGPSTDPPEMLAVFTPSPGMAATEPSTIESVLRRADEIFDELQRAITGSISAPGPRLPAPLSGIGLSARERDVVVLLLDGHRVSTIAQRLFLSPHTVRNHLKAIFRKARVGSQAALIDLARGSTVEAPADR